MVFSTIALEKTFWPVRKKTPVSFTIKNAFHFIHSFIIVLFDGESEYLFHLNWNQEFLLRSLPLLIKTCFILLIKRWTSGNLCSHVIRNISIIPNGWWAKQIPHFWEKRNHCEWMNVFMLKMRSKGRGGVFPLIILATNR